METVCTLRADTEELGTMSEIGQYSLRAVSRQRCWSLSEVGKMSAADVQSNRRRREGDG